MTRDARATAADPCHDCGRDLAGGGRRLRIFLWKSPATGREHWAEVGVCPACARLRDWRAAAQVWCLAALAAAGAFVAGYRLLP
jgi:hypothetical protein